MDASQLGDTIVIGAGQAGLAVARALRDRGVHCKILEAESPGVSWRRRWDSLRLFTPAQHCSLPGLPFPAPADALPTKNQVAQYLASCAETLPVTAGVRVAAIHREGPGFLLETSAGAIRAARVVVATGATSTPHIPRMAAQLAPDIHQLHSSGYRNAAGLPSGGVLVVGAGTSGLEIAIELAGARQVWIAGRIPFHVPEAVLEHAGTLYWQFIHQILNRSTPLGRKIAKDFTKQGGPLISVSVADARNAGVTCLPRLEAVDRDGQPALGTEDRVKVSTVIWATGYKPDYGWIDGLEASGPNVDVRGWPATNRGEVPALPGLWFVGLPFQYGLTSSLIGGVGRDAAHVATLIARDARREPGATTALG